MGKAKDCCGSSSDRDGIGSNGIMLLLQLCMVGGGLAMVAFFPQAVSQAIEDIKNREFTGEPAKYLAGAAVAALLFAFGYTTLRELNPQRVRPVWGPNG